MSLPLPKTASTLPTPNLSPTVTAEPSPAFSTVLQSPATSELELEPDYGQEPGQGYDPQGPIGVGKAGWKMPECWGHRGASATFPENTRASFIEACKAGADGIETDIHITADNQLVMFHDPRLGRTTSGQGMIHEQPWFGCLEHVRTKKKPMQPIPMFTDVLDILLQPENKNAKLNLDCKVENDPIRLFKLVKAVVEGYEGWATRLAPRIILGLWHPKFLAPAQEILPYLPRYAISMSIPQLRKYFFTHCHGFSVMYEALATAEGESFRSECRDAGKAFCVWTVNGREEMRECARWGVKGIISDKPALWREIRVEIEKDQKFALKPTVGTYVLPFLSSKNWRFAYTKRANDETEYLEREGGKFDSIVVPEISMRIAKPGDALI